MLIFIALHIRRDYVKSGSVYSLTDSGGECGVPYETYFQMPNNGKDKPWYSIEMASIHFTIISTEHNFSINSPQVNLNSFISSEHTFFYYHYFYF